jgi:hypothetical protein
MPAAAADERAPRWLLSIPALALGARVAIHLATWFSRDFNRDDFYLAYVTWLRAIGARPGVDFYVFNYNPLEEFFWPLFRAYPQSLVPLEVGKAIVLVVAALLLYTAFRLTRVVGASAVWGLAAINLIAWQKDFGLRISDIRSDTFGMVFVLLSLLVLLRRDEPPWFLAGVLFAIGVWFNIKLGLAAPAMAIAIVAISLSRAWRGLLLFAGGGVCGYAAFQALRAVTDGWAVIVLGLRSLLTGGAIGSAPVEEHFFVRAIGGSPGTSALVIAGALAFLMVPLATWRRGASLEGVQKRGMILVAWSVVFVAVFLKLYPFVFSYNLVILMCILGPLAAGISLLVPPRLATRSQAALLLLVSLIPVAEGFRTAESTFGQTSENQRRVVQWIWNATEPTEHVFDWQGMHWGRPGIFHWWNMSGSLASYQAMKEYDLADELRAAPVTLIINNYRLRWFHARDREFFATHYVRLDHCLFAPGRNFTAEEMRTGAVLDAFVAGTYKVDPPDMTPGVRVDGQPVKGLIHLDLGLHNVTLGPGVSPRPTRLIFTTPLREKSVLPCPAPINLVSGF